VLAADPATADFGLDVALFEQFVYMFQQIDRIKGLGYIIADSHLIIYPTKRD
jgi:hypothetical protein